MKPSQGLDLNRAAIRQVVASHRAQNARVFGSVIRGQDSEGSDLDLLIDTTPETTLMDVAKYQRQNSKNIALCRSNAISVSEAFFEGIERACANIPKDHT
jgi:predicted nucleotidyltransferase